MEPADATLPLPLQPRRKFHNKVKTACRTCKIRRVRCDEQKPSCKRCVTTGRKCDGYGTLPAQPLPIQGRGVATDVSCDAPLRLSGRPTKETRSYGFFLEVTAPSLGGAMHTTFWLQEVPRLCQQDPAIWHAIVSLSSAHESYSCGVVPKASPDMFTLQQSNSAIRSLMNSSSQKAWWRALAVSTIFSCISVLCDDYDQAQLHFKAGYNLLREFDTEQIPETPDKPRSAEARKQPSASSIPISLSTLRNILIGFEMRNNRLSSTSVARLPTLLSKDDSMARCFSYAAPKSPSTSGFYLTADSLGQAVSTAETLFYAASIAVQKDKNDLKASYTSDRRYVKRLREQRSSSKGKESFFAVFAQVHQAIAIFDYELEKRRWPRHKEPEKARLSQALLSLRLMHETNRLLLQQGVYELITGKPNPGLPALCTHIITLAEELMSLERTYGCKRSGDSIPNATVMNPLYSVARYAYPSEIQHRAAQLLRRPRMEGLWDSVMSASFADAILAREKVASQDYWEDSEIRDIFGGGYDTYEGWDQSGSGEENVHPFARICSMTMAFQKGRRAIIGIRTWWEWLEDLPGEEVMIQW